MKKRLRGGPEALASPEEGDTQTTDSTEPTSDPQSTAQVESVEVNQGLCDAHALLVLLFVIFPHKIFTISLA